MRPDLRPTPKLQAVGAAGAATTVLVWASGLAGLQVPPEVAAAVAVLISTGAGYVKRD